MYNCITRFRGVENIFQLMCILYSYIKFTCDVHYDCKLSISLVILENELIMVKENITIMKYIY